jgi:hypothetical protein
LTIFNKTKTAANFIKLISYVLKEANEMVSRSTLKLQQKSILLLEQRGVKEGRPMVEVMQHSGQRVDKTTVLKISEGSEVDMATRHLRRQSERPQYFQTDSLDQVGAELAKMEPL